MDSTWSLQYSDSGHTGSRSLSATDLDEFRRVYYAAREKLLMNFPPFNTQVTIYHSGASVKPDHPQFSRWLEGPRLSKP